MATTDEIGELLHPEPGPRLRAAEVPHQCRLPRSDSYSGVKRSDRKMVDLDALVPYRLVGRPEEVAALVALLASDKAAYMCGPLVEITGAQAVA
jgi:NAD(P)-dependent dehydrogenase (short-subunit alcohol dehydrogenase family)